MPGRSLLSRISSILVCGLVAGGVVAMAAFPAVAVSGLVAKAGADSFNSLPSDLKIPRLPQVSYVYASDGKTLITTFYDENRKDVQLSDIAPVMQQAIVAAEDSRFYQHGGVDLRSVLRALVANGSGGATAQGASTLTMQYVRNVLKSDPNLTPQERTDATADTAGRKVREMRYAVALEQRFSKQEILDRYLNIAYFGDGAYGIYAASETYFSVPPSQLTLPQAALIAGLVQSPDSYNPVSGDQNAALTRRTYVLDQMVKSKNITQDQATAAKATPLTLKVSQTPDDCESVPSTHNDWGFFCDYLRQWWDSQQAFGANAQDRENALREGGYNIVTSLDPTVQAAANNQAVSVYGYNSPRALPMAVVQPGTGRVLAMAVNRHYSLAANPGGHKGYPNTVDQLIAGGGGVDGYQAGSTFKMFTMLAALSQGKTLDTTFNAPSPLVSKYPASGSGSCGGLWCPVNDNPSWMDGVRSMWTGFGRSVNTYFVWLEEQIGAQNAVEMAKKLGITFRAGQDAQMAANSANGWGAFTLGVADTTPLDLANAYATVAANGVYCSPLPVQSITDASGNPVSAANPSCHQAINADLAHAATDAARCPVGEQSVWGKCDGGTADMVGSIVGRPVAGKTGSSENNATETFVGFTPQVAAAGIAADPDNPSDFVGGGISSAVDEAVAHTLAAALVGKPILGFSPPPTSLAFGSGSSRTDNGNGNSGNGFGGGFGGFGGGPPTRRGGGGGNGGGGNGGGLGGGGFGGGGGNG